MDKQKDLYSKYKVWKDVHPILGNLDLDKKVCIKIPDAVLGELMPNGHYQGRNDVRLQDYVCFLNYILYYQNIAQSFRKLERKFLCYIFLIIAILSLSFGYMIPVFIFGMLSLISNIPPDADNEKQFICDTWKKFLKGDFVLENINTSTLKYFYPLKKWDMQLISGESLMNTLSTLLWFTTFDNETGEPYLHDKVKLLRPKNLSSENKNDQRTETV